MDFKAKKGLLSLFLFAQARSSDHLIPRHPVILTPSLQMDALQKGSALSSDVLKECLG